MTSDIRRNYKLCACSSGPAVIILTEWVHSIWIVFIFLCSFLVSVGSIKKIVAGQRFC